MRISKSLSILAGFFVVLSVVACGGSEEEEQVAGADQQLKSERGNPVCDDDETFPDECGWVGLSFKRCPAGLTCESRPGCSWKGVCTKDCDPGKEDCGD